MAVTDPVVMFRALPRSLGVSPSTSPTKAIALMSIVPMPSFSASRMRSA